MRLFAFLLILLAPLVAQADTVMFEITGAQADGRIQLALFDCAKSYDARTDAVQSLALTAVKGVAQTTFNLPPGRYAAAVFQDSNGDGTMNTTMLGMPAEPYGFSGLPSRFGPPSFDQAAFTVPGASPIVIQLETF